MNQHHRPDPVPFIDIGAQRRRLGPAIDEAVSRVLTHCQFVNGPEVTELEARLAAFCGAKHVVTCASGTDALLMVLMAKGVGPGDAVLCPSFTFCATGESVALTGATPLFVDVDAGTFNIDLASLRRGIATAKRLGLKPKGIIAVDLFGQGADHDAIGAVAQAEGLFVLDDAAQSFGATYRGRRLGGFGVVTATSFFPAKPLGCYGDGGAIFTDDADLADTLRSIRVHGQGSDKYDNVRLGLTGRLDTNENFGFQLLDKDDLRSALLDEYRPDIYRRARVARQRTCPIGELIGPGREDRYLEYKSTMRWDVRKAEKAKYLEDAVVKTIAGFANSPYGGTLLVGVTDDGEIHGLEDDYATFSKRGERGHRDLWGQHLKNLLDRLGKAAATLVDWEFHTVDGGDIARISVDPSDHPVYETKSHQQAFWWRTPVSTDAVDDEAERARIIRRRWS